MIRIGLVTRDRGEIPNVLIPPFQCLPKFSSEAEARGSFPGVVAARVTASAAGGLFRAKSFGFVSFWRKDDPDWIGDA